MADINGMESLGVRDLRLRVAERLDGVTASQAKRVTDAVLGVLSDALGDGCAITLPGLGRFRPVYRAARAGTDPEGRRYAVPPRVVLRFRPARELAQRLAEVERGAG